jgi:hypothetical protein
MVKTEKVETLSTHHQFDDACLGLLRFQTEFGQQQSQPRKRGLGLLPGLAQHQQVSGRAESHRPALVEPDLNLSTHPAPIAQPSGRAPRRQCANMLGDL